MFSLLSANVFDQSSATPFSVLDPIDNTQATQCDIHGSNGYDEIIGHVKQTPIPVTPAQGPGVRPTAAHVTPVTPMGPGVPLQVVAAHAPPVMPMGPGVRPTAAHVTPVTPMGLGVTPTQGAEDDVTIPTIRVTAAKMKELRQKRYQRMQKMSPGISISAV
jgi:hypothetical protein